MIPSSKRSFNLGLFSLRMNNERMQILCRTKFYDSDTKIYTKCGEKYTKCHSTPTLGGFDNCTYSSTIAYTYSIVVTRTESERTFLSLVFSVFIIIII